MGYGLVNAYAAVQSACTYPRRVSGTFNNDTTVNSCGDIRAGNVFVKGPAQLELRATGRTVINSYFEVHKNARLNIKPQ
jgi:hypothetical protein